MLMAQSRGDDTSQKRKVREWQDSHLLKSRKQEAPRLDRQKDFLHEEVPAQESERVLEWPVDL